VSDNRCRDPRCGVHRLIEVMRLIARYHTQVAGSLQTLHEMEPESPLYATIAKIMDNRIERLNEATAEFVRLREVYREAGAAKHAIIDAMRSFGMN